MIASKENAGKRGSGKRTITDYVVAVVTTTSPLGMVLLVMASVVVVAAEMKKDLRYSFDVVPFCNP